MSNASSNPDSRLTGLRGQAAFVMGGTRGMNLGIAERLVDEGMAVAVASRDPDRVAAAVATLEQRGGRAMGHALDAREPDAVAKALADTAEAFGPLRVVVAGQAGNFYAPAAILRPKGFKSVVDIDLLGSYHTFHGAFRHLAKPGACLVAITAPQAERPMPMQAHVCAAKAGVQMLMKCLALEWGQLGVRAVCVSPGPITGTYGMDAVLAPNPAMAEAARDSVPAKRFGEIPEIAEAVAWLASDQAAYVNGAVLDVDGGLLLAGPEGAMMAAMGKGR